MSMSAMLDLVTAVREGVVGIVIQSEGSIPVLPKDKLEVYLYRLCTEIAKLVITYSTGDVKHLFPSERLLAEVVTDSMQICLDKISLKRGL